MSSLCLGMATAACSVQNRPKTQYSGQLTSTNPTCPPKHGTLIVQRDNVVFSPDDGTWTLEGKAQGNVVEASHSRPSFDHKTYATDVKATLTDTRAVGTYTTPSCSYAVDLARF